MAIVQVFAERRTGQKLYAPDLLIWGHKNKSLIKYLAKNLVN
jgi:hypothetical protein